MTHLIIDSPLGPLTLAASDAGLSGVWFEDHRYPPTEETLGERVAAGERAVLDLAASQLSQYLAGERTDFDLPLDPAGTPKQRAIWEQLRLIPRGQVTTYGAIAFAVGSPRGAQAAGQAVGHNPLSIVVPCHRVIGADGSLTGYAGGPDTKRALLALEGVRA
jgi:methylated-DNA-[protein]-cysteine S-methyltransferase